MPYLDSYFDEKKIYNLKNLFHNLIIIVFNFRCIVVGTLFQFENIHQNLIVYLFIYSLVMYIMSLLSNTL